jgi:hypothetical protein
MVAEGWIKIHRKLRDSVLWNPPLSQAEAWIDLLMECNHTRKQVRVGNRIVVCDRGESVKSLKTWANRWGWSRSKVRRFVNGLQTDTAVVLIPTQGTTHIRVCNYGLYQGERISNGSQTGRKRVANETQTDTNNNVKNVKNDKNVKNIVPPMVKILFEEFWVKYPKKVAKVKCEKAWITKFKGVVNLELVVRETVIPSIGRYEQTEQWLKEGGAYIPHPLTFINQERWNDEIYVVKQDTWDKL